MAVGDGFVGDAGGAGGDQFFRLGPVGRQVQVGEEGLLRAQACAFLGQWLLDLDDHLRLFEDLTGAAGHFGAGRQVVLVGEADGRPGPGLDPDFMPQAGQFAHGLRGQADPVLVVLDLLRHSDTHGDLPVSCCPLNKCRNPVTVPPPNSGGFSGDVPEKNGENRGTSSCSVFPVL
ncbi:hypothetical protein D3C72_1630590 [compost metagenome]